MIPTNAHSRFSFDQAGLICGYHFQPDAPGHEIKPADAASELQQAATGKGFVWLHFNLSHASTVRWMHANLDLPDYFFEQLNAGSSSSRIEHVDQGLLAVLNDVVFNFGRTSTDISTMWVYVQDRMLITARTKPLRSIDQLRAAVKSGVCFRSSLALLVHLLQDQAEVLVEIVRTTNTQVDSIEDRLLAQRLNDSRAELATTRRSLIRLQRLLAPEPGALFRLLNHPPTWLYELDLQELREATEEFSLVHNDLVTLVERIKLLQEELAAQLNEQSNRTLFTLTLVTVLALPFNIAAGLFGMNVGGIPFANNPHGFWLLITLVASFTLLVGSWAFRKHKMY